MTHTEHDRPQTVQHMDQPSDIRYALPPSALRAVVSRVDAQEPPQHCLEYKSRPHLLVGLRRGCVQMINDMSISIRNLREPEARSDIPEQAMRIPLFDGEFIRFLIANGHRGTTSTADNTPRFVLVRAGIRATWDGVALKGSSHFHVCVVGVFLPFQLVTGKTSVHRKDKRERSIKHTSVTASPRLSVSSSKIYSRKIKFHCNNE